MKRDLIATVISSDLDMVTLAGVKSSLRSTYPDIDTVPGLKSFTALVVTVVTQLRTLLREDPDTKLNVIRATIIQICEEMDATNDGLLIESFIPRIAQKFTTEMTDRERGMRRFIAYYLIDLDLSKTTTLSTLQADLMKALIAAFPTVDGNEELQTMLLEYMSLGMKTLDRTRTVVSNALYAPEREVLTADIMMAILRKEMGKAVAVAPSEVALFMAKCTLHVDMERDLAMELVRDPALTSTQAVVAKIKTLSRPLFSTEKALTAYVRSLRESVEGEIDLDVDTADDDRLFVEKMMADDVVDMQAKGVIPRYEGGVAEGKERFVKPKFIDPVAKGGIVKVYLGIVAEKAAKPYICSLCKKAFSDPVELAKHRRNHNKTDAPIAVASDSLTDGPKDVEGVIPYNLDDEDETKLVKMYKVKGGKGRVETLIDYVEASELKDADPRKRINFGQHGKLTEEYIRRYGLDKAMRYVPIQKKIRVYDVNYAYEQQLNMRVGPYNVLFPVRSGNILKTKGEMIPIAYDWPRLDEQDLSPDRPLFKPHHLTVEEILVSAVTEASPLRKLLRDTLYAELQEVLRPTRTSEKKIATIEMPASEPELPEGPPPKAEWYEFFTDPQLEEWVGGRNASAIAAPLLNLKVNYTTTMHISEYRTLAELKRYFERLPSPTDLQRDVMTAIGALPKDASGYEIAKAIYKAAVGEHPSIEMICPTKPPEPENPPKKGEKKPYDETEHWTTYFTPKYRYLLSPYEDERRNPKRVIDYILSEMKVTSQTDSNDGVAIATKAGDGHHYASLYHTANALEDALKELAKLRLRNAEAEGAEIKIPDNILEQVKMGLEPPYAKSATEYILYTKLREFRGSLTTDILTVFELAQLIYFTLSNQSLPSPSAGLRCPSGDVSWVAYFKSMKAWLNPKGEFEDPGRVLSTLDTPVKRTTVRTPMKTTTHVGLVLLLQDAMKRATLDSGVVRVLRALEKRSSNESILQGVELARVVYATLADNEKELERNEQIRFERWDFGILDYPKRSWESYYQENLTNWYTFQLGLDDSRRQLLRLQAEGLAQRDRDPNALVGQMMVEIPALFRSQTLDDAINAIKAYHEKLHQEYVKRSAKEIRQRKGTREYLEIVERMAETGFAMSDEERARFIELYNAQVRTPTEETRGSVLSHVLFQQFEAEKMRRASAPIIRSQSTLAYALAAGFAHYIDHYAINPVVVFNQLVSDTYKAAAKVTKVPKDQRKVYDDQYLTQIQQLYDEYATTYDATANAYAEYLDTEVGRERARDEEARQKREFEATKTNLYDQISVYEAELYRKHGNTVQDYLTYGCMPIMFADVEGLGAQAAFFKAKLRSGAFRPQALNDATLAHYIPELFLSATVGGEMTDAAFDERITIIQEQLWVYILRTAIGYIALLDPTRRKMKLPEVRSFERMTEIDPVTQRQRSMFADVTGLTGCDGDLFDPSTTPLGDVSICYDPEGGLFTCHTPESVRADIRKNPKRPLNPYTQHPYPADFIRRMKAFDK